MTGVTATTTTSGENIVPGIALSREDREEIYAGLKGNESFVNIAVSLDRPPSTISREVGRNGGRRKYKASIAQARAEEQRRRPKVPKLVADRQLCDDIAQRLKTEKLSPSVIARQLGDEG